MNKYIIGVVVAAFLSLLSWGQFQKVQADKARAKVAQLEASKVGLEEKAREAELLKETNQGLAERLNKAQREARKARGEVVEAPGAPVTGVAVALEAGDKAPFAGILARKEWIASAQACLDFSGKKVSLLESCLKRELDAQAKVENAQRKTKFWRTTCLLALAGGSAYAVLRR